MVDNKDEQKEITLKDVLDALHSIQNTLEEMAVWQRINGADKVKNLLHSTLDSAEKKVVYHLSDGKSTREISAMCNVSHMTVSNYWKSWNKIGIMNKQKVQGGGDRYLKTFELEDYGIPVPKLEVAAKQKASDQSQTTLAVVTEQMPSTEKDGVSK